MFVYKLQSSFPKQYSGVVRDILETAVFGQGCIITIDQAIELKKRLGCSEDGLLIELLPLAASMAVTPISDFNVGVVARGLSGSIYLGANMEFDDAFLGLSLHGEQSAINNAWLNGETGINALAVNAPPCGHCRQFLRELGCSASLDIIIRHADGAVQHQTLNELLPSSFGPEDLGIDSGLMTEGYTAMTLGVDDEVACAALEAAARSYAPYSGAFAGVALELENGLIVTGRYAGNAAYNPSLLPLVSALSQLRFKTAGKTVKIKNITLVSTESKVSQVMPLEPLAASLGNIPVRKLTATISNNG